MSNDTLHTDLYEAVAREPVVAFVSSNVLNNVAPRGWVWRCQACGKQEIDRYSKAGGWEDSCMLNSYLVKVA